MGIVTNSARLLVKLQGRGSTLVELERDSFTLGRKPDNDLSIEDHTVSSRHAKIIRVQSVYFLEDLKSTNGTAVNGQAIERAQLHDADVNHDRSASHHFSGQWYDPCVCLIDLYGVRSNDGPS